MKNRDYYSSRTGKLKETPELTLKLLKKLFLVTYNKLDEDGYFQKYFGYYCVDQGDVNGELGGDIDSMIFLSLKKENLWPIQEKLESYSEDDLFDMIEFLHDHCSKPLSGYYHQFNNCGHHYDTFNNTDGQQYFREKMNYVIKDYLKGYEISNDGEILELPDKYIAPLLEADIPSSDIENINSKIQRAVTKFRRHKSTLEDRKEALRELADVLEYLRPEMKDVLDSKDEGDIFNIANNFSIRHHNEKQKKDYDKAIWYSWIFYHYLATIHAVLRMVARKEQKPSS
ncbi:hypothetical protein [uncultured Lutibacter sp.]|uniref:hypothetical protein n=1 Tax=uncultured Lutibacter sp. TaxID=437739 RepID=UPI002608A3CF|nr:hypothetical protein [uncultured Lutibacter sp.]